MRVGCQGVLIPTSPRSRLPKNAATVSAAHRDLDRAREIWQVASAPVVCQIDKMPVATARLRIIRCKTDAADGLNHSLGDSGLGLSAVEKVHPEVPHRLKSWTPIQQILAFPDFQRPLPWGDVFLFEWLISSSARAENWFPGLFSLPLGTPVLGQLILQYILHPAHKHRLDATILHFWMNLLLTCRRAKQFRPTLPVNLPSHLGVYVDLGSTNACLLMWGAFGSTGGSDHFWKEHPI